eukprot:gnl/Hemi2/23373_TR7836_c0_g1_i1.p1 gnl/Hemi2/23373_TR7836_c0_g1~~gnl/Hemi2/23373_TR7836_c0_g1_i1.p1  ORF type:complete len:248 (-),score=52.29 gnl/Hemi2/23373_TR7836_c0_g1_i1:73-816(-)
MTSSTPPTSAVEPVVLNSLEGCSPRSAVLTGDYVISRASMSLARLGNSEVVALLSQVLEHLVKGELMQMTLPTFSSSSHLEVFNHYLMKTYFKTASLIACSSKAAVLLSHGPAAMAESAFSFGLHLGMAFQLMDDLLDFTATQEELGKPVLADMKLGLATAPVLFAVADQPGLIRLIEGKFSFSFGSGQDQTLEALSLVRQSRGLALTRQLAVMHCSRALAALSCFRPCESQQGLVSLVEKVLTRRN